MATSWIALIRAVNLGPTNKLPMSDLRSMLEALGYDDVRTHLQSGNAVFSARGVKGPQLERSIGARIRRDAGLDVPVMVRSARELDRLVAANPFVARRTPEKELQVGFLARTPSPAKIRALRPDDYAPDELAIGTRAVYFRMPNGYAKSKLPNVEQLLGVGMTTRTWKTVTRLADLAGD